jgi:CII-binding regulator of phage lambda lysogenization HflD
VKEALEARRAILEGELGQLCYDRLLLARQIDDHKKRIEAIDQRVSVIEATVREFNAVDTAVKEGD